MPQVINTGNKPDKPKDKVTKPKEASAGFPSSVNELPKPLIIGIGVLAIVFMLFMFNRYIYRLTPPPPLPHVAPPPGYPDIPPYNQPGWQKEGMRPMSGMPPPEALQRMNGGKMPKAGQ